MKTLVALGTIAGLAIPMALGVCQSGCVDLSKPGPVQACSSDPNAPCVDGDKQDAGAIDQSQGQPSSMNDAGGSGDRAGAQPDGSTVADVTSGFVGGPDGPSMDLGSFPSLDAGAPVPDAGRADGPGAGVDLGGPLAVPDASSNISSDAAPSAGLDSSFADAASMVDGAAPDARPVTPDLPGPELPSGPSTTVTFNAGRGVSSVINGYGWVTLGTADTVTSPTCGPTKAAITGATPCTASTNWDASNALCVTGSLPALPAAPTSADYAANWGLQVGVNVHEPDTTALATSYTTITINMTGSPLTGLRIELHRLGDGSDTYCAMFTPGSPVALTSFNTHCWDGSGTAFTAADVSAIDRIGVQVTSGSSAIPVTDLCLQSIVLGT